MKVKRSAAKYEVQHFSLCEGWINHWFVGDEPQTFKTRKAAQAELDAYFEDIRQEILEGLRGADEGFDPEEFRIRKVCNKAS